MAKLLRRYFLVALLSFLAIHAKEIDWVKNIDVNDGSIATNAIEMGKSYYLYVTKTEDLKNILDQLAEALKDLEIDDVRRWYLMQMQAIGYVVKLPLIKGQEHRYTPILQKYGIPSLNNRPGVSEPENLFADTSVAPAFGVSTEATKIDRKSLQPPDEISTKILDSQGTETNEETGRKADNLRWTKLGLPPTYSHLPTDKQRTVTEYPVMERTTSQEGFLPVIKSIEDEETTSDEMEGYSKSSKEYERPTVEDDDVETQFMFPNTPPPLPENISGIYVKHVKLPNWFRSNVAYSTPRYSVLDLFYMFSRLVEQMGYMHSSSCNMRAQETAPPNILPHVWVNALRTVESDVFNLKDNSEYPSGPPTARRIFSNVDNSRN